MMDFSLERRARGTGICRRSTTRNRRVLVPESEANFDSEIPGKTDISIPREPGGVFPVPVTVAATAPAVEWAVLRGGIPVLWTMGADGMILM